MASQQDSDCIRGNERYFELFKIVPKKKFISGLQCLAKASIYDAKTTIKELTRAQALVLSLLHALIIQDSEFCLALIKLSPKFVQLNSSFMRVWLQDDFIFNEGDVATALRNLSNLMAGGMELPRNIGVLLSGIADKYHLFEYFSKLGDLKERSFVASLHFTSSSSCQANSINKKDIIPEKCQCTGSLKENNTKNEKNIEFGTNVRCNDPPEIAPSLANGAEIDCKTEASVALSNVGVNPSQTELTSERNTLLHAAVSAGDVEAIKYLIKNGVDPNSVSPKGFTPLHTASAEGKHSVISTLIQGGADVNANSSGMTPLHLSANAQSAMALLNRGALIHLEDRNGDTPLHKAAVRGDSNLVKLLIKSGAEIDNLNKNGMTPLYAALKAHQVSLFYLLLALGADVSKRDEKMNEPLHRAAKEGDLDAVKLLLCSGVDVNSLGNRKQAALHMAAEGGHLEVVKFLLQKGATVNAVDIAWNTPLHLTVNANHVEVVKVLVGAGAKNLTNLSGMTPLNMGKIKPAINDILAKSFSDH